MKIIIDKFKKVADFCYDLFKISELKIYGHKFSKKIYTQYQHLFLLVYKQFRKFTYEELLTDIAGNSGLRAYLGLNKLPHYTTLIKFAKRLPMKIFEKLMLSFKKYFSKTKKVAIDATGISLDNASKHYCKRIGLSYRKRPFMKTTFVVDIEKYYILFCNVRKKSRHDLIDAKPMIKKLSSHYKPEIFYADRGYDDNKFFKQIFEKLGSHPLILQRRLDVPKHRRKGEYRKKFVEEFDYGEYLQRNKIETLNSMFKKRFGSKALSKNHKMQKIEILTRVIAYNIDRLIRNGEKIILMIIRITRISY